MFFVSVRKYTHSAYWKGKQTAKRPCGRGGLYGNGGCGGRSVRRRGGVESGEPGEMYYTKEYLQRVERRWNGLMSKGSGNYVYCGVKYDIFNPIIFAGCIAADIGVAVRHDLKRIADPKCRAEMKRELMLNMQKLRRPFYYAKENERRRNLAKARRKIHRRTTLSPMPTAESVLEAWNRRKDSKEAMIRLGGILHDLECFVDNCLRIDEDGRVVGRNRGIRGWLAENLPELFPKYKTLMRYKAMAIRLRQATETRDPKPTVRLLRKPYHPIVHEILSEARNTFSIVSDILDKHLSPDRIFDG